MRFDLTYAYPRMVQKGESQTTQDQKIIKNTRGLFEAGADAGRRIRSVQGARFQPVMQRPDGLQHR